jgi:N-acetylmuramoyl-L-alanine amidase-like protein
VVRAGRGARAPSIIVRAGGAPSAWTGFVRAMPGDTVLRDAPGTREPASAMAWLNRDGFGVLDRDAGGVARAPSLAGYRIWGASDALPPRYVAIAGGALSGHRIVLDPEGGGQDTLVNGPGGTRAAFVNLETARILAGLLRAAGAEVRLTREGDIAMSDVERVQASEAFHAERFVRIGHRAGRPRLGYYFSSVPGKRWAERTAGEFPRLGLPEPVFGEDAQYVVQQVSATALFASPSSIVADEPRLSSPGGLRQEAWALFAGLLRDLGAPEAEPDSLELRDAEGRPVPGAAITLGGALVLETDALGRARFIRTEPGPVEAVVDDPRARVRAVLLESSRGSVLTGCCGR